MSVDELRHVQMSGKWSIHPDLLGAAVHHYFTHPDIRADVLGATELGMPRLAGPLRSVARELGLDLTHPVGTGRNECAILSRVPIVEKRAHRLTPLVLRFGRTAPLYLVAARLEDGPWVTEEHTPAHNGGLDPRLWPTKVWEDAWRHEHTVRMSLHGGVLNGKDWNIDLARASVRASLGRRYPHMAFGWHAGQHPTEGGRVIDGVLTNLPILGPSITLPGRPGFDHRAVLTIVGRHRHAKS